MPPPKTTTHITAVRDVVPGVRELTLAAPDPVVSYLPGQWISLSLPVGEHPPLVRAYSLATPPLPSGELVLCFDRVPGGLGSEYLFGVAPGEEITFAGPLGNFVLSETPGDQLWMAYYTGIVPFRAMLQWLRQHPPDHRVTLVYAAATPEDLAYHAELVRAAEELPWFELLALVDTRSEGWAGGVGTVLDLLPELTTAQPGLIPMVCGKREFVRPIRDFFHDLGYDRRQVKWETYD